MRATLLNCLLSLSSILFCFVLLEGGLRLYEYYFAETSIFELESQAPLPPGHHAQLGDLLQRSEYPSLIYELKKNLTTNFLLKPLSTNAQGFRGPSYGIEKPPKVRRIVGIGDSLMFGWGGADQQSYLRVLEIRLNESDKNTRWQVINTAVPGYNTELEVETLRLKALKYAPDVVILGFVESNDLELPHFVNKPAPIYSLERSLALDFFLRRLTQSSLVSTLARPSAKQQQTHKQQRGLKELTTHLQHLATLAKDHNFKVIVYAHEALSAEARALFKQHNMRTIEAWPRLRAELGKSQNYANSQLVLSPKDLHPSAHGHEIAAELLFAELAKLKREHGDYTKPQVH